MDDEQINGKFTGTQQSHNKEAETNLSRGLSHLSYLIHHYPSEVISAAHESLP